MLYLGNMSLKPQKSNYFSFGPEYTVGNVTFSVTGYYNKLDDMITLVTIPKAQAPAAYIKQYGETLNKVRRYENMENASTYGVDMTVRCALQEWTFG